MGGGWSDKTKVILNSTQFKLKLKLELSLAIIGFEIYIIYYPYLHNIHNYTLTGTYTNKGSRKNVISLLFLQTL